MFQGKFVMSAKKKFAKMSKEMNVKPYQLKKESDNAPIYPSKYLGIYNLTSLLTTEKLQNFDSLAKVFKVMANHRIHRIFMVTEYSIICKMPSRSHALLQCSQGFGNLH